MKTRAAMLRKVKAPYVIEELNIVGPFAGEVVVKMAYAGLCGSDDSLWNGKREHPFPVVTGHEGSGIVEAVGEGVEGLKKGDRVVLNWQPFCGKCHQCGKGRGYLCQAFPERITKKEARFSDSKGKPVFSYGRIGCFAERVVVWKECCVPLPPGLPLDVAALLGCAVTTGFGAVVNTARVKKGESVVVFGAGGVGLSIVMGARLAGAAPIIVVDKFGAKRGMALGFGATNFLLSSSPFGERIKPALSGVEGVRGRKEKEDIVKKIQALTCGRGADYVFEVTGDHRVQEICPSAICDGGSVIYVGLSGTSEKDTFRVHGRSLAGRAITLKGSLYGDANVPEFFKYLADLHLRGAIGLEKLISKTYRLDQINEGFEALRNGKTARGVIQFSK